MSRTVVTAVLALAAALWSLVAPAQESPPLAQQEYQGVPYITGGVGEGERAQLKSEAASYNLKLTFAAKEGNYLADVGVVVTDAKGGKVLDVKSDGPVVMARLQPGSYRVAATSEGHEQQQRVTVPAHGQRALVFRW